MSTAYACRSVHYAPNCTPLLWAACKMLLNGSQILENYTHCVNASCYQMLKAKCHMPQIYFYETNKIPKVVIRLFNVWTELGSYRFNEINNYM